MPRVHGDAGCHRRGWDVGHGHGRSIRIGCGVRGGCGPLRGGARACGKTIFGFSFVLEVSSPTSFPAASIATRSPSHSHSLTPGDVNSLFGFRHASETGGPSDVDGASSGASRLSVRSVLGSNSAIVAAPFVSTHAAATHVVAFSLSDEWRMQSAVTRHPCRPIARLEMHGDALDALHAHTTPSSPALTTTPSRRTRNALTLSV